MRKIVQLGITNGTFGDSGIDRKMRIRVQLGDTVAAVAGSHFKNSIEVQ